MFEILTPTPQSERARWLHLLGLLPAKLRDPLLHPDYLAAETHIGNRPYLAALTHAGQMVIKPFVLRPVTIGDMPDMSKLPPDFTEAGPLRYWGADVCSPQGYGGPYGANADHLTYRWFDQRFTDWCVQNGVICEYEALNPMHLDHQLMLMASPPGLTRRKEVVWINTGSGGPATDGYTKNAFDRVKLAGRSGVYVRSGNDFETNDVDHFVHLYEATMARKSAARRWYFPRSYIRAMCDAGDMYVAEIEGFRESMCLVLHGCGFPESIPGARESGGVAYYHMTGNALVRSHVGANRALVHEVNKWCRAAGISKLHLGGGVTSADDDGVLAFKKTFSSLRAQAMSRFRIFRQDIYKDACAAKIAHEIETTGAEFTTKFEPLYRREAS